MLPLGAVGLSVLLFTMFYVRDRPEAMIGITAVTVALGAVLIVFFSVHETVRTSQKRLAAMEAAGDGIGLVDAAGNLTYLNHALMTLHGLTPRDLPRYIGQPWQMLYSEKGRADIIQVVMPALRRQGYWRGESPIVRADGQVAIAEMTLTLLEDGGFIGTARDVTERRRTLEEKEALHRQFLQAQKMESVGRLTGGIAHDFNNLLTVVSGNLDILDDSIAKLPGAQKPVEAMRRAVTRGADLTQRLLAFSRRQVLKPQRVNFNDLIPDAVTLIRRALNERIEIVTRLGEQLDDVVIDAGQLENALLNMAINARDAMPNGGILTFATSNADAPEGMAPGPCAVITISDSGSGIPPEVIAHIFEPFFTTKEVGTGTGLGLSMVYGFAKQSGGHITVDSTPGQGAVFRLYFPVASADAPLAQDPVPAPSGALLKGGHETLLLVESEPDILDLASSVLSELGYAVHTARSGPQAILMLDKIGKCDLLLTSFRMPGGIDGRELAFETQEQFPGAKILYISGHARAGDDDEDILPQDAPFLSKPYTREQLARAVREVLES